ncbi:MAG: PRC-barrel domain-containing protein [Coriobacteriales bacterium]|jgi:sporulation protein YlmC with PRC-barrel domain|nr:PRC-barrel domain-containing protein [Coriobacteriales bacterium]
MRSSAELNGVRVLGGKHGTRRIGKVLRAIFYPDDFRLAGFLVKRPDLLWLFKRHDRFFAWDSYGMADGRVVVMHAADSWDSKACARIGLDWDQALILQGMAVVDSHGEKIGRIDAVEFDPATGRALTFLLSTSLGAKALIGQISVPVEDILCYKDYTIVLRPGVEIADSEGGLAAKAGEQAAIVGNIVKTQTEAAGVAIGELVDKADKGAQKLGYETGKVISSARYKIKTRSKQAANDADNLVNKGSKAFGRQIGKTKGMFKAFQDEYDKASKDKAH